MFICGTETHIAHFSRQNNYILQNRFQVDTESSSAEMSVNDLSHNSNVSRTKLVTSLLRLTKYLSKSCENINQFFMFCCISV